MTTHFHGMVQALQYKVKVFTFNECIIIIYLIYNVYFNMLCLYILHMLLFFFNVHVPGIVHLVLFVLRLNKHLACFLIQI